MEAAGKLTLPLHRERHHGGSPVVLTEHRLATFAGNTSTSRKTKHGARSHFVTAQYHAPGEKRGEGQNGPMATE